MSDTAKAVTIVKPGCVEIREYLVHYGIILKKFNNSG